MTVDRLHISYGGYLLTCLRLYGVPDSECEDVRQDLYLKLLENKIAIRDDNIKGFCSQITRRMAIDFLRKTKHQPAMEPTTVTGKDGVEIANPAIDATAMARWETIIANPNVERIAAALELAETYDCQPGGPTAYDVITDLLYGLTMKQIGEKHGVSYMTVSRWMADWYAWVKEHMS